MRIQRAFLPNQRPIGRLFPHAMRRVAFTHFERPDKLTGKMRRARYMLPLDDLPKDAVSVGQPEWRDLPETEAEQESTSGWQGNSGVVPPKDER